MERYNVVVLGGGLVGRAIAADLHSDFNVTAVDLSNEAIGSLKRDFGLNTMKADLSDPRQLLQAVKDADIVVGALPGFMGYKMIQTLAPEKKNIVDISFFPEDPFGLDLLARDNGITVVTDCGVAPGMGNIILGHHNSKMVVDNYECYVGGLPVVREWPWEYKAVFSPVDLIEEYTRPARYVENGHMVVREALSDPQLLHFDGIGSLEAWNSDGLRTLIRTMQIPNMIEKTLRYPGCIEYLRVLREAGFFSYEEVDVNGVKIRPIDMTAALLFPKWKLKPGEEDFTIMRIIVEGNEDGESMVIDEPAAMGAKSEPAREIFADGGPGRNTAEDTTRSASENTTRDTGMKSTGLYNRKRYVWELLDRYDKTTGTISMARTTGYTCTAAVHLIAKGMFSRKGICPPEYLGEDENNFRFILKHLEERGVNYYLTSE